MPVPPLDESEEELERALEADGRDELRRALLVAIVSERIERNNADQQSLPAPPIIRATARSCVRLVEATPAIHSKDCGREGLPTFVTGGNVMAATEHDLSAIELRPSWMMLNYDGIEKSRSWLLSDPRCQGMVGGETGKHCHEYPYNKTEQGGQSGDPEIAPIPSFDNTSQGGSWGAGITLCAMRPAQSSSVRGDAFLVVPVPDNTVPTFWLCNGKSASSQPPQPPM